MRELITRILSGFRASRSTNNRPKGLCAFTVEMTPQNDESAAWAAKFWNKDEGGIFYIRACYPPSGAMPNDGMALRYMERHLTEFRSGRLRFRLAIAHSEQTPTLVDDMVDEFPPSTLITRKNLVLLHRDDRKNEGVDLLRELGMST